VRVIGLAPDACKYMALTNSLQTSIMIENGNPIVFSMFKRQTSGTCTCVSCNQLISVSSQICPNCNRKNPSLWGYSRVLKGLGADLGFTKIIIGGCLALYLATLLVDLENIQNNGLSNFLSPSITSLWLFGASGSRPVFEWGCWWTLLSAGWLHGSLLHIVFNMAWVNTLALQVVTAFGAGRLVIIYTIAIISGFLASSLAGEYLPSAFNGSSTAIGASGGIFGLLGAVVAYGQITKDFTVKQEAWTLAIVMFVIGVITPNVDNWGHFGGFVGGFLISKVPGIVPRQPEGLGQIGLAIGCLAITLFSILASIAHAYTLDFFDLPILKMLLPH
jgi:rhomboid protease GluP